MKNIDTSKIDIEINPSYTMMRRVHDNLYLSLEQMEILEKYNIDYKSCKNLHDLLYVIEEILDECDEDDLVNLADMLAERDYYENYNK